jgi:hypothetical protein
VRILSVVVLPRSHSENTTVWNNIRPILVQFVQAARDKRLKKERIDTWTKRGLILSQLLADYHKTRSFDEIIPGTADIACMDVFISTIQGIPVNTEVTPESFAEAILELPRLTQEWRISKDRELVRLMNPNSITALNNASESTEHGEDLGRLELATTFFKCSCQEPISYPRVLEHTHLTQFRQSCQEDVDLAVIFKALDLQPWNYGGERIAFHDVAYDGARAIIEACGLNPDTTTASDMDKAGHMLECLRCRDFSSARRVMGWRWAVRCRVY